jgi:hypothetical protein
MFKVKNYFKKENWGKNVTTINPLKKAFWTDKVEMPYWKFCLLSLIFLIIASLIISVKN